MSKVNNTLATVLASQVFIGPLTLAKVVGYALKAANPDNVDITEGLAYLRPVIITGWVALGACLVTAVVAIVAVRNKHAASAKLPITVLAVSLLVGLVYVVSEFATNSLTG